MREKETPRLSYQGLLVLRVFLDQPSKPQCGSDLLKIVKLSTGTLYPILLRFEKYGLLESEWEDVEPNEAGRPRRRLYKITPHGAKIARHLLGGIAYPINDPISDPISDPVSIKGL